MQIHTFLTAITQKFLVTLTTADPVIRSPIAISLGAIPGALCRYYISLYFSRWFGTDFPFGTFFINLTGAFLMGVFVTVTLERSLTSLDLRLLIAVGFLGSYTTFSTYALAKYRTKKLGDAKTHLHTVRDSIEFYADDQSQHEKCSWLCVHAF